MAKLGKPQLHELYYYLKLTERLLQEIANLSRDRRIPGPIQLTTGLQALEVGSVLPMEPGDVIGSWCPAVGSLLARGTPVSSILAHFLGTRGSPSAGREGSLGLSDPERGVLSAAGHYASHVSVMAGLALAFKARKLTRIALAMVPEQALACGDLHEGLNFAAVRRLPLVLIVTTPRVSGALPSSLSRLSAYGISCLPLEGHDVLQVLQMMEAAVQRCRSGKGVVVIEASVATRPLLSPDGESSPVSAKSPLPEASVPAEPPLLEGVSTSVGPSQENTDQDRRAPTEHFESFLASHGLLHAGEREAIQDRVERDMQEGLSKVEADSSRVVPGEYELERRLGELTPQ